MESDSNCRTEISHNLRLDESRETRPVHCDPEGRQLAVHRRVVERQQHAACREVRGGQAVRQLRQESRVSFEVAEELPLTVGAALEEHPTHITEAESRRESEVDNELGLSAEVPQLRRRQRRRRR